VACNQGAAACDAPWLALVNPDCFVQADSLARLHEHALASGGGLIGADLVDEDGQRDAAARRRDPDFAAMLRNPARMRLGVAIDEAAALQCVDAVSGALMLLPRALFERVGGFDPGYRLHAEDLDLCRRVRAAGATVACANDVRVLHVRGVSSRTRPLFVEWHKHRGLWRYYRTHAASGDAWPLRAAVFAAIWARFPWALLNAVMRVRRR
jgi:GT2 family glycosyltransferase